MITFVSRRGFEACLQLLRAGEEVAAAEATATMAATAVAVGGSGRSGVEGGGGEYRR